VNVFYARTRPLSGTSQVLQQASPEGGDRFGAALVGRFTAAWAPWPSAPPARTSEQ
jgi:hypothetical protein